MPNHRAPSPSSSSSDDEDMGYDISGTAPPPVRAANTASTVGAVVVTNPSTGPPPPIAHFQNFQNQPGGDVGGGVAAGDHRGSRPEDARYKGTRRSHSHNNNTNTSSSSSNDDDESASTPSAQGMDVVMTNVKIREGEASAAAAHPTPKSTKKQQHQPQTSATPQQKAPPSATKSAGSSIKQHQPSSVVGRTTATSTPTANSSRGGGARGGGSLSGRRSNSQRNMVSNKSHRKSVLGEDVIVLGENTTGSAFGTGSHHHQGGGGVEGGGGTSTRGSWKTGSKSGSNKIGSSSRRGNGDGGDRGGGGGGNGDSSSNINTLPWSRGKLIYKDAQGSSYVGVDRISRNVMMSKEVLCESIPNLPMRYTLLKDEITRMTKLDHENVVRYHGIDRIEDTLIIISDLVPGGRLEDLIKEFGPLDEQTAAVYLYQVLCGLDYLHSSGFSHCNVKSSNVIISTEGTAKLADYGSTLFLHGTGPSLHESHESARWAAPEVVRAEGTTTSIDIWSLGCLTMELVFGQLPFEHLGTLFTVMMSVGNPELEMALPPDSELSPECSDFITRCLRKHPSSRPKTSELLQHPFLAHAAAKASAVAVACGCCTHGSRSGSAVVSATTASSSQNHQINPMVGALSADTSHDSSSTRRTVISNDGAATSSSSPSPSSTTGHPQLQHQVPPPVVSLSSPSPHTTPPPATAAAVADEEAEIAQLRAGSGPVCTSPLSIFCLLDDPAVARCHQSCILSRAAYIVACSTTHAHRCARTLLLRCQRQRIAYLKQRAINTKLYGRKRSGSNNSSNNCAPPPHTGNTSGNSWPTRSDGITSDGGGGGGGSDQQSSSTYRAAPTTTSTMVHTLSALVSSGGGGGGGGGGPAQQQHCSPPSPLLPLTIGTKSQQQQQESSLLGPHFTDNTKVTAAGGGGGTTSAINTTSNRRSSSLNSDRSTLTSQQARLHRQTLLQNSRGRADFPPDVREQEEALEAGSSVALATLSLITQTENRRTSLFLRDGRPGFKLSSNVDPPQWWPRKDLSSSVRDRGDSNNKKQQQQHRQPSLAVVGDKRGSTTNHIKRTSSKVPSGGGGGPTTQSQHSPHTAAVPIAATFTESISSSKYAVHHGGATSHSEDGGGGGGDTMDESTTGGGGGGVDEDGDQGGTSITGLADVRSDDDSVVGDVPLWGGATNLNAHHRRSNATTINNNNLEGGGDHPPTSGSGAFSSGPYGSEETGSPVPLPDLEITATGSPLSLSPTSPQQQQRQGSLPRMSGSQTGGPPHQPPASSLSNINNNNNPPSSNINNTTSHSAAKYYFINPRVPPSVFIPMEMTLKLGDESSLHHFLPPVDEGGLTARAGTILVAGITGVFLLWSVVVVAVVLAQKEYY